MVPIFFFFGGGGLILQIPIVFVLFWFVFSSFLWLLVWVSSFLVTSFGNLFFFLGGGGFFFFCVFFWFCCLVCSVLFLFFFFFFFFSCFSSASYFSGCFVLLLFFSCSFSLWPFFSSSFQFFLFKLLLYLWSSSCVFLVLVLPLAFSLVSFLSWPSVICSCFSLVPVCHSPFTTWGGRSSCFHFLLFQNATFAIFAPLVSAPFLGVGPVFVRKHYKLGVSAFLGTHTKMKF